MERSASRWWPTLLLLTVACAGGAAAGRSAQGTRGAASPLEVTRAFYAALHAGDADRAAALVASPQAGPTVRAFVTLARAYQELEEAVAARFGREAASAVGYADRTRAEDEALREARVSVEGDRATVTSGDRTLATLRRLDGVWRIVLEDALAGEQGLAALVLEAESSREAAARVSPAIRQGLFDEPADALEAFRNEVAVRVQGERSDLPQAPPGGAEAPPGLEL